MFNTEAGAWDYDRHAQWLFKDYLGNTEEEF
jgi:hypothetical protein